MRQAGRSGGRLGAVASCAVETAADEHAAGAIAPQAADRPAGVRAWYGRNRVDVLLVGVVVVLVGPIVQVLQAHQASRLALTAAIVERATITIDAYEEILGVDYAERGPHLYSDKAPGQPFLATPPYRLYRLLDVRSAADAPVFRNMALWWLNLWTSALPAAALAVAMRRAAVQIAPPLPAAAAALGMATGTMLLPFGSVLFAHVLAALLVFGCYLLARAPGASPARLALAGFTGGAAVLTEYTGAIVVAVVGILAVVRHRGRAAWFVAGGVPAAALLALYNTAAWGGPLRFSYRFSGSFGAVHATGLFGAGLPTAATLSEVTVGERGLLTLTPIVLAAVVGAVALARRRGPSREAGVLGLVVFGLYVLLQAGWVNPTGGASPGPRYVVPSLPFLAFGAAEAFRRRPRLTAFAAGIGVVAMLLATFTNPLAQPTEDWALGHWVWRTYNDRIADTLLTMRWGDATILLQLAVAAALAVRMLVVAGRTPQVPSDAPPAQGAGAGSSAAAIAAAKRAGAASSSARNRDGSVSSTSRTTGPRMGSSTRSTRA